ncbi:MAG: class I SAM-dependent methyltransferase [Clostridiales bacterium]|nr:class I SAM-dependent methyltransferase [Clostridiales bacterium]
MPVKVLAEDRKAIYDDVADFCKRYTNVDVDLFVTSIFAPESAAEQFEYIETVTTFYGISDFSNGRMLEVGSGYGLTLAYAIQQGYDVTGIEPDFKQGVNRYQVARRILKANDISEDRIIAAYGEQLPFSDNSFDRVFSVSVLEHVQDPEKVVCEIVRVLRPGGYAYINVPNYGSLYEGHYRMPWIPHMTKSLARRYVSLWGRCPDYIDELHFITRSFVKKMMAKHSGEISLIGDLGRSFFADTSRMMNIQSSYPELVGWFQVMRKTGLLWLGLRVLGAIGGQNSFQIIFQKRCRGGNGTEL